MKANEVVEMDEQDVGSSGVVAVKTQTQIKVQTTVVSQQAGSVYDDCKYELITTDLLVSD
jgi:hypothetical protein